MHPFRTAVEAGDMNAAVGLLAEDVVFHSPVVFSPYLGREAVASILHAVATVFSDFHYVTEIGAPGAADHCLVFRARVGEREIEGCDIIHVNDQGSIDELTVMVRPLSAALALGEAMRAKLTSPAAQAHLAPRP